MQRGQSNRVLFRCFDQFLCRRKRGRGDVFTAQKARELGFNTVQLDLHFKDLDLTAGQITKEKAKLVADTDAKDGVAKMIIRCLEAQP